MQYVLQGTSVLSPVLPLAIVIVLALMIWQKSDSHIYENHPCLYILSFSMVGIKVTNKLIVSRLIHAHPISLLNLLDITILIYFLLLPNAFC